jgi:AcrR family transcriptional regulator
MSRPPAPAADRAARTRAVIATKARELFFERGYEATSVRAIAAAADIDPALVIRYFGSKEKLFLEVAALADSSGPDMDVPLDRLGRHLVAYVTDPEHIALRRTYAALMRAAERDSVREQLRDTMRDLFVSRLTARLPGADPQLRAELISALLGGLLQGWSGADDDHLIAANHARVVTLAGQAIQHLIDNPAEPAPTRG